LQLLNINVKQPHQFLYFRLLLVFCSFQFRYFSKNKPSTGGRCNR